MKPSVLGLAIATLAFGASSIYLAVQLNDERAQAEKVAESMAERSGDVAELFEQGSQLSSETHRHSAARIDG